MIPGYVKDKGCVEQMESQNQNANRDCILENQVECPPQQAIERQEVILPGEENRLEKTVVRDLRQEQKILALIVGIKEQRQVCETDTRQYQEQHNEAGNSRIMLHHCAPSESYLSGVVPNCRTIMSYPIHRALHRLYFSAPSKIKFHGSGLDNINALAKQKLRPISLPFIVQRAYACRTVYLKAPPDVLQPFSRLQ